MRNAHLLSTIAVVLLLVGGLNWGLVGLFQLDLITAVVGDTLARIIFVLVGVAAVLRIVGWAKSKGR